MLNKSLNTPQDRNCRAGVLQINCEQVNEVFADKIMQINLNF